MDGEIDLAFAGFRSLQAGPDDPIRLKWDAVRTSLDIPESALPTVLAGVGVGLEKITDRNALINFLIVYTPEPDGADVWQTPSQTLLLHRGDCEDFAILKYALLRKWGLPARIVVGEIKSISGNLPHAWCATYLDGHWLALDNKFDQLIKVGDYINWLPIAAMHDAGVVRFGREFSINEMI
jgi:transglutaminase-like putative cysteine protease